MARAGELGISTWLSPPRAAKTALELARALPHGIEAACVTHHVGSREPGKSELSDATENRLAAAGIRYSEPRNLFSAVSNRAIRLKFGGSGRPRRLRSLSHTGRRPPRSRLR